MFTFKITRAQWEAATKVYDADGVLTSITLSEQMNVSLKLYKDYYTVLVAGYVNEDNIGVVISESIVSKTHRRDEPRGAWVKDPDQNNPTDDEWIIEIQGWREVDKVFTEHTNADFVNVKVTNSINPTFLEDGVDFPNEGITAESLEDEFLRRDAAIKYLKEQVEGEGVHNVLEEAEIDTDQIVDTAVTRDKLDKDSVTTDKIEDGAVTYPKLSLDVQKKISDGGGGGGISSVETGDTLTGDGSDVNPLDVADGGVTERKLSADVVNKLNSESNNVPDGGTTGQALSKKSNTDGDVEWSDFLKFVTTSGQFNGDGTAGNPLSLSLIHI